MFKRLVASILICTSIGLAGNVQAAAMDTRDTGLEAVKIEEGSFSLDQEKHINELYLAGRRSGRNLRTNIPGYEIINPNRRSFSTGNKVALINGRAPARRPVNIKVYGTTDMTRRSYNLNRLPRNKDYILVSSQTVRAGNLGFFQKQLNLVSGINKVVIDFGRGVRPIEIIIYSYGRAPSLNQVMAVIA